MGLTEVYKQKSHKQLQIYGYCNQMIQKQMLKSSEMWHHVPGWVSPDPVPSNSGPSSPKIWMALP